VLTAGTHSLRVRFFELGGGQTLQVSYAPPDGEQRPIPANGQLEGPGIPPEPDPNFTYKVYAGNWGALPNFNTLTPVAQGVSPVIDLSVVTSLADHFGVVFTGTVTVQEAGEYTFATNSDDGSDLRVGGTTVVHNDGQHGLVQVEGTIQLAPGTYALRVRYFEAAGAQALQVSYAPPGGGKRAIPTDGVLEGPPDPSIVGWWSPVIAWPHIAISAATLPDGRVLTWSSTETDGFPANREFTYSAVFDPSTQTFTLTDNGFHDMFCAGVATLEDGRIVAAGGNPVDTRTSTFDPATLAWSPLADMNFNRWYGTELLLADNQVWSTFANGAGSNSERYNPASDSWFFTSGASMEDLANEQNAENGEPEANTASTLQWWSQMAVMPDGRIFHGGPTQTFHVFDPNGLGAVQSLGQLAARARACGATRSRTTRARCCWSAAATAPSIRRRPTTCTGGS
jgi:hypothetical protein